MLQFSEGLWLQVLGTLAGQALLLESESEESESQSQSLLLPSKNQNQKYVTDTL